MTESRIGYTSEELEAQYNARAGRPDFDTAIMPDWIERSRRFRDRAACTLDLAYGDTTREKIDFFPAAQAGRQQGDRQPLLVFLHGGYWQRGDRKAYSFVADPFVKNGVSVAVVGYELCPNVRIRDITPNVSKAVAWIWRNAGEIGFDRDRLYLAGHSAGGHLTAMMMGMDWTSVSADLPADLIRAAIPISGLMELAPLLDTSINAGLMMDEAEAKAESPMVHPPLTDAPQLVVTGGLEPDEFQRQSDIYVGAFATPQRAMERYVVPGCDHFDEINQLAHDGSDFFCRVMNLIERESTENV